MNWSQMGTSLMKTRPRGVVAFLFVGALLIIEDEVVLARSLARGLEASGHRVQVCLTAADGIAAAEASLPDLALVDLRLPDGSGIEILRALREMHPDLPVVLMTAHASISDAVEAIRIGAIDYLQKPLKMDEVRFLVERVLTGQQRDRELAYLRSRDRTSYGSVIGEDPRLLQIFDHVDRLHQAGLKPSDRPAVLLTGETGTGKGLLAKVIHERLGGGPFIDVNCTAIPDALVEAELFGHERGTFTDAKTARPGLFAAAEGGTLFLDEIGSLGLPIQAKFLKVIEEKRVRRLGSNDDRKVDVHIIAATNQDLDDAVGDKSFRSDLLHRLRVLEFKIPPLRERKGDILLLASHFVESLCKRYGFAGLELPEEIRRQLAGYEWPGNVRELRNVIERAVLLSGGRELDPRLFSSLLSRQENPSTNGHGRPFELPEEGISLEQVERDLMQQALDRTQGNRSGAARLLRLTRDTLRYRLEKHGLS